MYVIFQASFANRGDCFAGSPGRELFSEPLIFFTMIGFDKFSELFAIVLGSDPVVPRGTPYDSIVYNLRTGDLYDEGYFKAKKDRFLDIVLEENPFPEINILRSFVFNIALTAILLISLPSY